MYKRTQASLTITLVLVGSALAAAQPDAGRGMNRHECTMPDGLTNGTYTVNIWPEGVVPYRFNANVTAQNQQRAIDAMAEIEAVCNVDFIPATSHTAYLFINDHPTDNNSCVGYSGTVCTVNIHEWESKGLIIHEFGHSLGLYHEHQRPDRETYVQVNLARVCGATGGFVVLSQAIPFGPYDFESVMHYARRSNSRDGNETISVRPAYPEWKYFCGQYHHLSNGDIWMLTQLYGGAPPPRAPSPPLPLVSPLHRAQVGPGWSPTFQWGSAELADSYHLQVDDDPYFASPEIDVTITGTMHPPGAPLPDGHVYYWRVLALNATGETEARPRPVHMFLTESTTPSVLYVDDTSALDGTGASWASAMRDLGDALALAECSAGQVTEIRVAQGVYRPDRGTGDRESTFRLAGGVQVRCGYAGVGTPDPDQRDLSLYPTVLSGDLAGDDQPGFVNYEENSWHVVSALGVSPACTLDGLTITAGNADGVLAQRDGGGAGVFSRDSHVILNDCRVVQCSATDTGGRVFSFDGGSIEARGTLFESNRTTFLTEGGAGAGLQKANGVSATLIGCTFRANTGLQGAGANIEGVGSAILRDCLFEDNVATLWVGGVQVYRTSAVVDRCTFRGNVALSAQNGYAGAFGNYGLTSCTVRSVCTLTNCLFEDNSAAWTGGAINNDDSGTVNVINCTIVGNTAAAGRGGGIANTRDFGGNNVITIVNSIVRSSTGGQIVNLGAGSVTSATYTNVEGGWPGTGNITADPLFLDPMAGDFRLAPRSPCIDSGFNPTVPAGTDLAGNPRFRNDPSRADTGVPDPTRPSLPIVDMGVHEFQGTSCPADFNNNGALNSQDFFDFITAFFAQAPAADFNGNGAINSQDFFDFITAFFAGCT